MKNFVQPGENLTIPAPYNVLSGGVVIAAAIIGIAAGSAASGAPVDVATTGVFDVPKVGANAFTLGASVYWDSATSLATTVSSGGNVKIGVAVAAAAASTGTVRVRLSGF